MEIASLTHEYSTFIDNLAWASVGRNLAKGDTLPEPIHMSEFKYPLKPNRYQAHFYVFANIYTECNLTEKEIEPVEDTEMQGAFGFKVLSSDNDSIRILFENHTNLSVQPVFLPSVETDKRYMAHPLARSGWSGEVNYMRKYFLLKGGRSPSPFRGTLNASLMSIRENILVPADLLRENTR